MNIPAVQIPAKYEDLAACYYILDKEE